MKAIHNYLYVTKNNKYAVNDSEKYNFESNSQRYCTSIEREESCQRQRKIQFWKQFTTIFNKTNIQLRLSTTAKNTILKAIHNASPSCRRTNIAVNDSEKYNFESNSQLGVQKTFVEIRCQRQRKIQFWKQFTTPICRTRNSNMLSTTAKNTILKAIHNDKYVAYKSVKAVNDSEKYNFESNSQLIVRI